MEEKRKWEEEQEMVKRRKIELEEPYADTNDEWEEEEIEKEVRRMKGILGKDVDEEPEVELPDEEMKLRELRKDYDDSEFV